MCGIAGVFGPRGGDKALLATMAGALRHRGPNDSGVWSDPAVGVGLAHTRLSIMDLSLAGHQPMVSGDGRWIIAFNGEIYNHSVLRGRIEAEGRVPLRGWQGHSDTETLVEAIAAWGIHAALQQSVGMFALAVWDSKKRHFHLARDRFGEKPLYYGRAGRDFLFASELKAIRRHPDFDAQIDRNALAAYAALTVVPTPLSIYHGISKLPPATILTIDSPDSDPKIASYWSYRDVVLAGIADPIRDEGSALEALDATLREAIAGQAVADVPIGAFLSGGIDSSTIVALYQAVSGARVKTYTIGFDEDDYDESAAARRVAEYLGTDHHEHQVGVAEARDVIPLLPGVYDEPFADSSQIPTYLVSRFARGDVTVAISGDGGDELFAGYHRHLMVPRMWNRLRAFPLPLRRLVFGAASIAPEALLSGAGRLAGLSPIARESGKIRKFAQLAASALSVDDVTDGYLDEWHDLNSPVCGADRYRRPRCLPAGTQELAAITYADAVAYLPDDILVKVDRAAMAVSLETRVPFLDHRVAELAARIPPQMKVRGGKGKHILREVLYRRAPRALFERPKAGFAIPIGEWLKGPLRAWAEDLLEPRRMAQEGWFDPRIVRRRWDSHLSGRRDSTPALWAILMFQAWLDEQRAEHAASRSDYTAALVQPT